MKKRIANCPACGGLVEFQLSTALVTVCDYCHTVVARADKKLEDHGKVADLVETNSPIKRGLTGQFEKKSFEVVGRVQYQHPAGGVWDEFYLKFPGDKVRWLAQAQGKYYLTTEKRLNEKSQLPGFESLSPGHRFELPDGKTLVVAESGIATARSADGDIPWAFRPNAEHRFVDLHGEDREFATIDYDASAPRMFLGREISLDELKLAGDSWESSAPPSANTAAMQLNCPKCAGPLTLRAPDQTLSICCPSCKSLLDCQQGKLEYLQTLTMKLGEKPLIPLGAFGRLRDVDYTVIGFMERYVIYDQKKYSWTEYLLSNPTVGYRWLVRNKGHWSLVEPVPVSSVKILSDHAIYQDETFRLFDKGSVLVQYVAGEFYWRVSVNEQVGSTDYIAPPRMLSIERTMTDRGSELNISLGTYVEKQEIETAFALKELPAPWGVGAIQPPPRIGNDLMLIWLGCTVLLIVLNLVFSTGLLSKPISQFHFIVAMATVSSWPLITLIMRRLFEVSRWNDSDYSPYNTGGSDE